MYQSLKRNNNLYREFSLPNFVCAQGFQNKKKKNSILYLKIENTLKSLSIFRKCQTLYFSKITQ